MLCFSSAPLHSNHHASYLSKARRLMDQKTPLHRSHRPVLCTGVYFVKDSQIHCRHHCPFAPSHMKPNQCSAVLDWKLEAVSTKSIDFSPFPLLPPSFPPKLFRSARDQKALSFSKVCGVRFQTLVFREKDTACWGFVFSLTLSHLCTADFKPNVCRNVNNSKIPFNEMYFQLNIDGWKLLVLWEERRGLRKIPLHCGRKIILIRWQLSAFIVECTVLCSSG